MTNGLSRRGFFFGSFMSAAAPGLGGAALVHAQARPRSTTQPRPNIVFMLADNVGYGVLSSYNGGILDTPTPRIDSLAVDGLRLTNFNVGNQCRPSRAALMTGRLPIRSGIYGPRDNAFSGKIGWMRIDIDEAAKDADHLIGADERFNLARARQ